MSNDDFTASELTSDVICHLRQWLAVPLAAEDIGAARQRFQADPARIAFFDGALLPDRYRLLRQGLTQACEWIDHDGLAPVLSATALAAGQALAGEYRQHYHSTYCRSRPGQELSPGHVALLRLRVFLASPAFLAFLHHATGVPVLRLQNMLLRRMGAGDAAGRHSDADAGRRLCLLIYFSDGWNPGRGGPFILHMPDGDRSFDPLPNRMLLFDVKTGQQHSVPPLSAGGDPWYRYALTAWYC